MTRSCERRTGRGFTLAELMLVVALIGAVALLAVPRLNGMVRRMSLAGAMRTLYAGLLDAQSRARTSGIKHRLELDKVNDAYRIWSVQDTAHPVLVSETVLDRAHTLTFRQDGYPQDFPAPYAAVPRNAWCTFCGKDNPTGYIQFDGEGLLDTATVRSPTRGSITLYDSTGATGSIESLVFIGSTGDIRLFRVGS